MVTLTRPLYQRVPEIELEEGARAAAIADEETIDGWDPWLHVVAWMDPRISNPPKSYVRACELTDRYYRWVAERLYQIRLGDWVG